MVSDSCAVVVGYVISLTISESTKYSSILENLHSDSEKLINMSPRFSLYQIYRTCKTLTSSWPVMLGAMGLQNSTGGSASDNDHNCRKPITLNLSF